MGATSRANSVRFDETANQNHFSAHSSRPSLDLTSRQSSGYSGGLHMSERTPSHKSEPRASSAHSLRSAASGRASSLTLDYNTGESSSPLETPGIAPGLLLLGPTPAIIRCWLDRNFKHSNLHYAAICTGSCRSWIDLRIIQKMGIEQAVRSHEDGPRTMMIRMYFSEGVQIPTVSSRSRSPITSQLPSLELEFCVSEHSSPQTDPKAIQIIIGSDVLHPHRADILFSTSKMTIYDNENKKLTIPLVRPEDEAAFIGLAVTSGAPTGGSRGRPGADDSPKDSTPNQTPNFLNGLGRSSTVYTPSATSTTTTPPPGNSKYRPPGALAAESGSSEATRSGAAGSDTEPRLAGRQSITSRPSLGQLNTRQDDGLVQPASQPTPQSTGSGSGLLGSWRNNIAQSSTTSAPTAPDWAGASKAREPPYTRRDTGIKVLKPKTANRTFSGATTAPATPAATGTSSPSDNKSRFFDAGRLTGEENKSAKVSSKDNLTLSASKPSKANPIGGGSAFQWLGK